jgi:hypothetical protein
MKKAIPSSVFNLKMLNICSLTPFAASGTIPAGEGRETARTEESLWASLAV